MGMVFLGKEYIPFISEKEAYLEDLWVRGNEPAESGYYIVAVDWSYHEEYSIVVPALHYWTSTAWVSDSYEVIPLERVIGYLPMAGLVSSMPNDIINYQKGGEKNGTI